MNSPMIWFQYNKETDFEKIGSQFITTMLEATVRLRVTSCGLIRKSLSNRCSVLQFPEFQCKFVLCEPLILINV